MMGVQGWREEGGEEFMRDSWSFSRCMISARNVYRNTLHP